MVDETYIGPKVASNFAQTNGSICSNARLLVVRSLRQIP